LIVTDASALLDLLLRRPGASAIQAHIEAEVALHAPHLVDTEILHALRRRVARGELAPRRAEEALEVLADLPLVRYPHPPLSARVWSLRERLSAYDATYAALAEGLGAALLTADRRLARGAASIAPVFDVSR